MSRPLRPLVSDHIVCVLDPLLFAVLMPLTACQPAPLSWAAAPDRRPTSASANSAHQSNTNTPGPNLSVGPTSLVRVRADHIGVGVTNFEESVRWYTEKLGAREEVRWASSALPGSQLAYLDLNGFRIEIIGTNQPRPRARPVSDLAESLRTQGFQHLCLETDDVDALMAELNRRGVETFMPATTRRLPGTNYTRRVGHVRDNNGNVIELVGPSMDAPQ